MKIFGRGYTQNYAALLLSACFCVGCPWGARPIFTSTLRVNGTATITTDPALLERFVVQGKPPKCVLVINVATVFFQCARAIHQSRLWQGLSPALKAQVPRAGEILAALTDHQIDGAT